MILYLVSKKLKTSLNLNLSLVTPTIIAINLHVTIASLKLSLEMIKFCFYSTAIKDCWGIVFTHGVWMGRRVGGRKKFVRAVSQKL